MRCNTSQKLVLGIFLLYCALLGSCRENDACETTICQQGKCLEGNCKCDIGYEGQFCDTLARSKFLGNFWNNTLACQSSNSYLVGEVKPLAADLSGMVVSNIYQQGDSAIAYAKDDTIVVPQQVLGVNYIEGLGFYGTEAFTIEFVVTSTTGFTTNCVAHFHK